MSACGEPLEESFAVNTAATRSERGTRPPGGSKASHAGRRPAPVARPETDGPPVRVITSPPTLKVSTDGQIRRHLRLHLVRPPDAQVDGALPRLWRVEHPAGRGRRGPGRAVQGRGAPGECPQARSAGGGRARLSPAAADWKARARPRARRRPRTRFDRADRRLSGDWEEHGGERGAGKRARPSADDA